MFQTVKNVAACTAFAVGAGGIAGCGLDGNSAPTAPYTDAQETHCLEVQKQVSAQAGSSRDQQRGGFLDRAGRLVTGSRTAKDPSNIYADQRGAAAYEECLDNARRTNAAHMAPKSSPSSRVYPDADIAPQARPLEAQPLETNPVTPSTRPIPEAGGDPAAVAPYNPPPVYVNTNPALVPSSQVDWEVLVRTMMAESKGDPTAHNTNSTAKGLFQFTDSTAKVFNLDPYDPYASIVAAGELQVANAMEFEKTVGRPPEKWERYLMHVDGAGAAIELEKNPASNAIDVLTKPYGSRDTATDAVLNNGGTASMTAADYADKLHVLYDSQDLATGKQKMSDFLTAAGKSTADVDAIVVEKTYVANNTPIGKWFGKGGRLDFSGNKRFLNEILYGSRTGTNDPTHSR